jgi:hypothetical protein
MMVRLEAEEALRSVQVQALGSGLLETRDFRKSIAEIERAAYGKSRTSRQATPAQLQAAGIGVIVVPPADGQEAPRDVS